MTELTSEDITDIVGNTALARGQSLMDRLVHLGVQRQDHDVELSGLCVGSMNTPYEVRALISTHQQHVHCSCPIGLDGRCKHSAALLLCWHNHPERFCALDVPVDPKTQSTLLAFILNTYPQARGALGVFLNDTDHADHTIDIKPLVDGMLTDERALGLHPSQILARLTHTLELVNLCMARAQYSQAIDNLTLLTNTILDHQKRWFDADRSIQRLLTRLMDVAIQVLLMETLTTARRRMVWDILIKFALNAHWSAGAQQAHDALILNLKTSEYADAALFVRQHIKNQQQTDHPLLLALESPTLDRAIYLERCINLGLDRAVVRHLIELDDRQTLEQTLTQAEHGRFFTLAQECAALGKGLWVAPLIEQRFAQSGALDLLSWLVAHHTQQKEWHKAMTCAQALCFRQPTINTLNTLRHLATQLGQWSLIRPNLIQWLIQQNAWDLLFTLELQDKHLEGIWQAIEQGRQAGLHHQLGWLSRCVQAVDLLHVTYPERTLILCHNTISALARQDTPESTQMLTGLKKKADALKDELQARL